MEIIICYIIIITNINAVGTVNYFSLIYGIVSRALQSVLLSLDFSTIVRPHLVLFSWLPRSFLPDYLLLICYYSEV